MPPVVHGTTDWPNNGGDEGWGVIDLATGKLWVPAAVNLHTGGVDYWTQYVAPAIPGATGPKIIGKIEGTARMAAADAVVPAGAVQRATPADLAAEGQYVPVQVAGGRLWTTAKLQVGGTDVGGGNPVPVTGAVTISDGAGPVTVDGSVTVSGSVTISDGAGPVTVDGTVSLTGTVPLPAGAATEASLAALLAAYLADQATFVPGATKGVPAEGAVVANDYAPTSVTGPKVVVLRAWPDGVLMHRQDPKQLAAEAYEKIIDALGAENIATLLPLWETGSGAVGTIFNDLLKRDRPWRLEGTSAVTLAQRGGLHGLPNFIAGTEALMPVPLTEMTVTASASDSPLDAANRKLALRLEPGTMLELALARVRVKKVGAVNATYRLSIYNESGGVPSAIITDGSSGTITWSTNLETTYRTWGFSWPAPPKLLANTRYWLVLECTSATLLDASNYVHWQFTTAPAGGNANAYATELVASFNGSAWTTVANQGFWFQVWDAATVNFDGGDLTVVVGHDPARSPFQVRDERLAYFICNADNSSVNYLLTTQGHVGGSPLLSRFNDGANRDVAVYDMPASYSVHVSTLTFAASTDKMAYYQNGRLRGKANGSAGAGMGKAWQPPTFGTRNNAGSLIGVLGEGVTGLFGPIIICRSAPSAATIGKVTYSLLGLRRYQEAI